MNNGKKIVLGIIAFIPITYIVLGWILILPGALGLINDPVTMERGMILSFELQFIIHMLFFIAHIVIILTFILIARKNKSFQENTKIIWFFLIIYGSPITIPIYWYKYILKTTG